MPPFIFGLFIFVSNKIISQNGSNFFDISTSFDESIGIALIMGLFNLCFKAFIVERFSSPCSWMKSKLTNSVMCSIRSRLALTKRPTFLLFWEEI